MIDILLIDPSLSLIEQLKNGRKKDSGSLIFDWAESHEEALAKMISYPYELAAVNGGSFSANEVEALAQDFAIWEVDVKLVVIGTGKSKKSALKYLEAGACAYVLGEQKFDNLLGCLKHVAQSKTSLPANIAAAVITRIAELAQSQNLMNGSAWNGSRKRKGELTPREQEVLALIANGCSNREIGKRLYIEIGTVKNHVHSLLSKLELSSRHEAAKYFTENGNHPFSKYVPVYQQISNYSLAENSFKATRP